MINKLCIIVPVYNEQHTIRERLNELHRLNTDTVLVFVDGNSSDQTVSLLEQEKFKVIQSPSKGRGAQLSFGITNAAANCDNLLMLHIDTQLPDSFVNDVNNVLNSHAWGYFPIKLNSNKNTIHLVEYMMNLRSKLTSIATGDQAIFVRKHVILNYIDKLSEHALMEDIYISKTLKRNHGRAKRLNQKVLTSTRYWENHGVVKSILKMWIYRFLYFLGFSPKKLYNLYYR